MSSVSIVCPACSRSIPETRAVCPCQGPLRRGLKPEHDNRVEWFRGRLLLGPIRPGIELGDGTLSIAGERLLVRLRPDLGLGYPHIEPKPEILARVGPAGDLPAVLGRDETVETVTSLDLFFDPETDPADPVLQ